MKPKPLCKKLVQILRNYFFNSSQKMDWMKHLNRGQLKKLESSPNIPHLKNCPSPQVFYPLQIRRKVSPSWLNELQHETDSFIAIKTHYILHREKRRIDFNISMISLFGRNCWKQINCAVLCMYDEFYENFSGDKKSCKYNSNW